MRVRWNLSKHLGSKWKLLKHLRVSGNNPFIYFPKLTICFWERERESVCTDLGATKSTKLPAVDAVQAKTKRKREGNDVKRICRVRGSRTIMLIRQARNFSKAYAAPLSSSLKTLFPSPADVVPGVAADVADVTGADDLVYTEPPVPSTVKPAMEPSLLQPGVVIYDGVCHLCHGGMCCFCSYDRNAYLGVVLLLVNMALTNHSLLSFGLLVLNFISFHFIRQE